jgi:hypothetical protein
MKPAWDGLAEVYRGHKSVVIGDVDCTSDRNKDLCGFYEATSYPTVKYFSAAVDKKGVPYEGGRELVELLTFANEHLGESCSWTAKHACTRPDKKTLNKYGKMAPEERAAMIAEADAGIEAATSHADTEVRHTHLLDLYRSAPHTAGGTGKDYRGRDREN